MLHFDHSWTLFLDRDGVINLEKQNDYVHTLAEFRFYPGAPQAIAKLSHLFRYVIVVTNQKGIGKGVTLEKDVQKIHEHMVGQIVLEGGRVDAIFYCPDTNNDSPCRKPNPGMAFEAKEYFSGIDFSKSLMVGNNISDLNFGRNAGMKTAFVRTTSPDTVLPDNLCDLEAKDLTTLAEILANDFVHC
jgi:histidinol-phosphate phosphatase family protein